MRNFADRQYVAMAEYNNVDFNTLSYNSSN